LKYPENPRMNAETACVCLVAVLTASMVRAELTASESLAAGGGEDASLIMAETFTGYTTAEGHSGPSNRSVREGNTGFGSATGSGFENKVWRGGSEAVMPFAGLSAGGLMHSGVTGHPSGGGNAGVARLRSRMQRVASRNLLDRPPAESSYYLSAIVNVNHAESLTPGSWVAVGLRNDQAEGVGVGSGLHIGARMDEASRVYLTAGAGDRLFDLGAELESGEMARSHQVVLRLDVQSGAEDALSAWVARDGERELKPVLTRAPVSTCESVNDLSCFVMQSYSDAPGHANGVLVDHVRFGTSLASVTAIGDVAPRRLVSLDDPRALTDAEQFLEDLPFSFVFGGNSGRELLATWEHEVEPFSEGGREGRRMRWRDPETGLRVTCELTLWPEYEASEWVVYFENTGVEDTPILEDIQGLDLAVSVPSSRALRLRRSRGCTSGSAFAQSDFLPFDVGLHEGTELKIDPSHTYSEAHPVWPGKRFAGRSSEGALPFFNLDWEDGGVIGAIGWSGMWELTLERADGLLNLVAGQQKTHLRLRPGERVRTPRILLLRWEGTDRMAGHNQFRRLMLDHYVPRLDGEVVVPPLAYVPEVYALDDVNETNQLEMIEVAARFEDFEAYWLDAGWYGQDGKSWSNNRGSWVPKPGAFPRGVKTVGDAARAHGLGFVLWFEPETVARDSIVAREHPGFLLGSASRSLFNLGNPEARKWMTDLVSNHIKESGVTILRIDYNFPDPLSVWRAADAPDRQGITENFYIQGLYEQWDEWLRRHPGLAIDNVASGGRRIDLETISRSYSLWRSDSQNIGRPRPVEDQVQTAGLSLYVPLHAAGMHSFEPYAFRSAATMGLSARNVDLRALSEEEDKHVRRMLAQTKMLRPLWLGDYYPLFEISADERAWCGWQFHRPDLGKGFAMVFRREDSPYAAGEVDLRALDPQAEYKVWFVDEDRHEVLTGEQLQRWLVELGSQGSSRLMIYEQQAK
jgi:alpha-galactosidase